MFKETLFVCSDTQNTHIYTLVKNTELLSDQVVWMKNARPNLP